MEITPLPIGSSAIKNCVEARPKVGPGALKSGPEPQDCELLERNYRDKINANYGRTLSEMPSPINVYA